MRWIGLGKWIMKSETLMMYGGAAVLVIAAYLGVSSMLRAGAIEDARIEGINKARSIAALVSQDEASFGTAFRDATMTCASGASDAKLPNAVWDHYVTVLKAAVVKASDENYAPRGNQRWFIEAQRSAEAENPLPETALAKLDANAKKAAEDAITEINRGMAAIGECLVQTVQK
jgi:hypothetical protein